MTRLVLVRHGYVDGIAPPRFRGREDLPLTETGKAQARLTAAYIAARFKVDRIFASPMARCLATARAIADTTTVPVQRDERLVDIDYGEWTSRTHEDVQRGLPDLWDRWQRQPQLFRFPLGESLQDLAARSANLVRDVLALEDETAVAIGHDSTIRALLVAALDLPLSAYRSFALSPCSITSIEFTRRSVSIVEVNQTAHLEQLNGLPLDAAGTHED